MEIVGIDYLLCVLLIESDPLANKRVFVIPFDIRQDRITAKANQTNGSAHFSFSLSRRWLYPMSVCVSMYRSSFEVRNRVLSKFLGIQFY